MKRQKLIPKGFASEPMHPMKRRILTKQVNYIISHISIFKQGLDFSITPLQGGRMKIKFDRFESAKTNPNASGKSYSIIRVFGTALEGKMADQEYSTQFFASDKALKGQVEALSKGDTVDVKVKKNGQYWNPVGFEKVETVSTNASVSNVPLGTTTSSNPRLENLKTAIKVLGPKSPDEDACDYLSNAAGVADLIDNYVKEKGSFQFPNDTSDGIPEVDDEDL